LKDKSDAGLIALAGIDLGLCVDGDLTGCIA
jgi:hypothetical protein